MKITLDYRNPTPSHCDVAVYVNGALAGTLTLRQEELDSFRLVIKHGLGLGSDAFSVTGNPDPPGWTRPAPNLPTPVGTRRIRAKK